MGRKSNLEIFIRLLPIVDRDWDTIKVSDDKKVFMIKKREKSELGMGTRNESSYWSFYTNGIMENVCQEEVFATLTNNLFDKIFCGQNAIIMAVGQPNSGKSYTLTGLTLSYENRGLLLRLVTELFKEMKLRSCELQSQMSISFVEFVSGGKIMYDLLTKPATMCSAIGKEKKLIMNSEEETMRTLFMAERRRWMEGASNCGTSIITIHLDCISLVKSQPFNFHPKILLVEVSGSMALGKDARSFTCLSGANLMKADIALFYSGAKPPNLGQTGSKFISSLDKTWHSSLIRVVCTVRPTVQDKKETFSTLMFAMKLKHVSPETISLQRSPNVQIVANNCYEELNRLSEEILLNVMVNNGYNGIEVIGQAEMDHLENLALQFLNGELNGGHLLTIAPPSVMLEAVKKASEKFYASSDKKRRPSMEQDDWKAASSKHSRGRRTSTRSKYVSESVKPEQKKTIEDIQIKEEMTPPTPRLTPDGVPSRSALWAEFLVRYPHLGTQIQSAHENYEFTLSAREESYLKFDELRTALRVAREALSEAQWKRRMEIGDVVGADGQLILSEEEKNESSSQIETDTMEARRKCMEAAIAFAAASKKYTETKYEVEIQFQEYCRTAYGIGMPLLVVESEPIECWVSEEKSPFLTSHEKEEEHNQQAKYLYNELQGLLRRKERLFQPQKKWI